MSTFELQTPNEFYSDFCIQTATATNSIWIQTMNFDPDSKILSLVKILTASAARGCDVRINVDWIAQIFFQGKFAHFPLLDWNNRSQVKKYNQSRQKMYRALTQAGVKLCITNIPNFLTALLPSFQRNHIKLYIVDSKTAWVGGVNLMDYSFDNIDFMVKITNQAVVSALVNQFSQVNKSKPKNNYTVSPTSDLALLVDCGSHRHSVIYQSALTLTDEAKERIIFMSQFVPDGPLLLQLVKKAASGVKVMVITSDRNDEVFTSFPLKLSYQRFTDRVKSQPNISLFHLPRKVHTKLLLVDGNEAIFGSHNFSTMGVVMGTEEIAIKTTNRALLQSLQNYVKHQIDQYRPTPQPITNL